MTSASSTLITSNCFTLISLKLGSFPTAATIGECLALARDLGDQELIAAVLPDLGYLAHQQGDQARAIVLLRESLVCCRELDYPGVSAWSLAGLSRVAVAQGQLERAAQL